MIMIPCIKLIPIIPQSTPLTINIWPLIAGGLWWQVQLHWNVGTAGNMQPKTVVWQWQWQPWWWHDIPLSWMSVEITDIQDRGLSWPWSYKTDWLYSRQWSLMTMVLQDSLTVFKTVVSHDHGFTRQIDCIQDRGLSWPWFCKTDWLYSRLVSHGHGLTRQIDCIQDSGLSWPWSRKTDWLYWLVHQGAYFTNVPGG